MRTERASPAATPAAPGLPPFAEGFVAAHNQARAEVSPAARPALPQVRWSPELAGHAQAWADRCVFEHGDRDFGENLSARTHYADPAEVVGDWVAEAADWNHARKRCAAGQVCGHYTQVVWRDSTQIGCAVARCGAGGPFAADEWYLWVCNYSPAGNWSGERPY